MELPILDPNDAMLMDVARKIQLSKSKHESVVSHYNALCEYVERKGSQLENIADLNYPSGSFAVHAAILSKVSSEQYDGDVVIELLIDPDTDPQVVLETLYSVIKSEPNSRYYDCTELNSRCVTVTYSDGVTIDLMPVARLAGEPERAATLFHYKPEKSEKYHKVVNPKAFSEHFLENVEVSEAFAKLFERRRMIVEKAETEPMPEYLPLDRKSPRIVALQLTKRARDLRYRRKERRGLRKPPSIIMAASALKAGAISVSLVEEFRKVIRAILREIERAESMNELVEIHNPAYEPDEFTDRWPGNRSAQQLFLSDLREFEALIDELTSQPFDPKRASEILNELFGETAATYALDERVKHERSLIEQKKVNIGTRGRVITGASASTGALVPPSNTNMGSSSHDLECRQPNSKNASTLARLASGKNR